MDLVFAPSQIETRPIDQLRPCARNAKIAASLAKFGWAVPLMVADDGELIARHGWVLAAAMLALMDVPVTFGDHLIEPMSEALAHAKGEGPALILAPITPREVREKAHLTQAQMAPLMGMSLSG